MRDLSQFGMQGCCFVHCVVFPVCGFSLATMFSEACVVLAGGFSFQLPAKLQHVTCPASPHPARLLCVPGWFYFQSVSEGRLRLDWKPLEPTRARGAAGGRKVRVRLDESGYIQTAVE